jgi:hypothetical protein
MVLIEPGTVLQIAQNDYLYGTGTIRLRVEVSVPAHPRLEWVSVHGVRLLSDGRETGSVTVVVRVAAIQERR